MDCPKCENPMDKAHINTVSKEKLTYFTNWYCEKCGHREYSNYDVKI
ncbi:MAG: hypothetical protein IIC67_00595 [Thaumarchaeota archaeon]|nr:hypothetical protein [Nitrososphaerota archaeon]